MAGKIIKTLLLINFGTNSSISTVTPTVDWYTHFVGIPPRHVDTRWVFVANCRIPLQICPAQLSNHRLFLRAARQLAVPIFAPRVSERAVSRWTSSFSIKWTSRNYDEKIIFNSPCLWVVNEASTSRCGDSGRGHLRLLIRWLLSVWSLSLVLSRKIKIGVYMFSLSGSVTNETQECVLCEWVKDEQWIEQ